MTVFQHEGDGENTEHLQSMDLHDVKTALEKDAELDEVNTNSDPLYCTFKCIRMLLHDTTIVVISSLRSAMSCHHLMYVWDVALPLMWLAVVAKPLKLWQWLDHRGHCVFLKRTAITTSITNLQYYVRIFPYEWPQLTLSYCITDSSSKTHCSTIKQ